MVYGKYFIRLASFTVHAYHVPTGVSPKRTRYEYYPAVPAKSVGNIYPTQRQKLFGLSNHLRYKELSSIWVRPDLG